MTLHPLAERFALVADAYERGRPDYAPAAIGALAAEVGLPAVDPEGEINKAMAAPAISLDEPQAAAAPPAPAAPTPPAEPSPAADLGAPHKPAA